MQNLRDVRQERTGWRDDDISARHRRWGWDCPMVDIDFLSLEYDKGKASALVEYKNEHAAKQLASHPSYQAIIDLGTNHNPPLPVFAMRYASDWSWCLAVPLNDEAKKYVPERRKMTEREWVTLLYRIRGYEMPPTLFDDAEVEI